MFAGRVIHHSAEGAAPGWGKLDAAPHAGLARPDLITKPVRSYLASGQGKVSPETRAHLGWLTPRSD